LITDLNEITQEIQECSMSSYGGRSMNVRPGANSFDTEDDHIYKNVLRDIPAPQ